jgi:hypothetical protein
VCGWWLASFPCQVRVKRKQLSCALLLVAAAVTRTGRQLPGGNTGPNRQGPTDARRSGLWRGGEIRTKVHPYQGADASYISHADACSFLVLHESALFRGCLDEKKLEF